VFYLHIHRTRAVAILLVVALHLVGVSGWDNVRGANDWTSEILNGGSTIFLFISGFLFWPQFRKTDALGFMAKKAKVVLMPYLIVSIPAIAVYTLGLKTSHLWLEPSFFELPWWEQVPVFLATGAHLGPLWFIPTILMIFAVSPVLAMFNKRPKLYALLPFLLLLTSLVPRPTPDNNPLQAFIHFVPVYICGMYFYRQHDAYLALYKAHPFVVLASLAAAIAGLYALESLVPSSQTWMRVVEGVAIATVLHSLSEWRASFWRIVDYIAATSFAIYFVHGYLAGFGRAFVQPDSPESYAVVLVRHAGLTLLVLLICVGVAAAARRVLGGRSKYVLGY
jgi:surface polysaccharide O-acyltransferase-like enzyme